MFHRVRAKTPEAPSRRFHRQRTDVRSTGGYHAGQWLIGEGPKKGTTVSNLFAITRMVARSMYCLRGCRGGPRQPLFHFSRLPQCGTRLRDQRAPHHGAGNGQGWTDFAGPAHPCQQRQRRTDRCHPQQQRGRRNLPADTEIGTLGSDPDRSDVTLKITGGDKAFSHPR